MSQNLYRASAGFPPRKRFTVKDCRTLFEKGIIGERTELINGDIVEKPSQSRLHIVSANKILGLLNDIWGMERITLWAQIGIGAQDDDISDPEPDLALLTDSVRAYLERWPRPDKEVLLVVEIADPITLHLDLKAKARIYARAGVPEYWVVDVEGRWLIVHRQPSADTYASVVPLDETATVAPLAAPASVIAVRDLLP